MYVQTGADGTTDARSRGLGSSLYIFNSAIENLATKEPIHVFVLSSYCRG